MISPQSFMDRVVNFIIEGSIKELENLICSKFDVNRFLLPGKPIYPIPSISKQEICPSIYGPTMLILAVLCEQPNIVKFILSFDPDLSIKVNGYNALHYASLTKDSECLKVLLTCSYYQKNILVPISNPNNHKETTNSLHIAVSNRNIESAALLLNDLPQVVDYVIEYRKNAESNDNNNNNNRNDDFDDLGNNNDDDDDDDAIDEIKSKSGIDVNSLTTNGSTPLHIAAYTRDLQMCRLLLSFSADVSIKDSKGRIPAEIALSSNTKIGKEIAKLIENPPDDLTIHNYHKIDDTSNNNDTSNNENQNNNIKTTRSRQKKKISSDSSTSSDSSSSSDDDNSSKKKRKHKKSDKLMKLLIKKIDQFSTRLGILEDTISSAITKTPPITATIISSNNCVGCNSSNTKMCPTCHHYFCSKCMKLSTIHSCV